MRAVRLYIMQGPPASGKTTRAWEIAAEEQALVISIDAIWRDLVGQPYGRAYEIAARRLAALLHAGHHAIIDSYNVMPRMVEEWCALARRHQATPILVRMRTPLVLCEERNWRRERPTEESRVRSLSAAMEAFTLPAGPGGPAQVIECYPAQEIGWQEVSHVS